MKDNHSKEEIEVRGTGGVWMDKTRGVVNSHTRCGMDGEEGLVMYDR